MTVPAARAAKNSRRLLAPLLEEETAFHAAMVQAAQAGRADEAVDLAGRHLAMQLHQLDTVKKYETLRDFALANVPMDERLILLLSGTRTLLASDVACVLLLDVEGKELWPRASVGFETAFGARPLAVNGSIRKVLVDDVPLLVDEVKPEDRFRAEIAAEGIRSLIAAPLRVRGKAQGVLVCGHKEASHYDESDQELLAVVADRMGATLDRRPQMDEVDREGASARRSSEFKTQLLHMATHDLKTPLAALTMQLDLMSRSQQTDAERERSIKTMKATIARLNVMLEEFLDLARVEANRLVIKPAPLEVATVLGSTADVFQAQASAKDITLATAEAPGLTVLADERRLAQVTANLVSNALRYSPSGSVVTIGARAREDEVELFVKDQGIGVTEAQMEELFKPFSQVQGVAAEAEGTGLGLYLSQAIIKAHGGRLWLESGGKGQGTRAVFTLPRAR